MVTTGWMVYLCIFPSFFSLLFLIPPATCLPGLPFMSVLGTSLVGVLISALPRYFCLSVFCLLCCLLPQPLNLPASPSLVCACLLMAVGSLSPSSLVSFHLPLSVQLSHHSYLSCLPWSISASLPASLIFPPYLSLHLISLGFISLSLSL